MTVKTTPRSISGTEYRFHKNYDQSAVQPPTLIQRQYAWSDVKTGVDMPDWRERIRRHKNATTPYSVVGRKCFRIKAELYAQITDDRNRTYIRGMTGHPNAYAWGLLSDPSGLDVSYADIRARQRFLDDYRSKRTAFQGQTFLVELKEAVEMIRHPAKALREGLNDYYRNVKKRVRKGKRRFRDRIIRDTWLEYSFGWTPFIHDMKNAKEYIPAAGPKDYLEDLRGGHRHVLEKDYQKSSFASPNGARAIFVKGTRGYAQVLYKGAIKATVQSPGFPEQLGFSWSNFLPAVWEAIPYSFLIDYFTNVGKVIDGLSTGVIDLAWGSVSTIRCREAEIMACWLDQEYLDSFTFDGYKSHGYATGTGPLESITKYDRSAVSKVSVGIRDFAFEFPTDWRQWANMAALKSMRSASRLTD